MSELEQISNWLVNSQRVCRIPPETFTVSSRSLVGFVDWLLD